MPDPAAVDSLVQSLIVAAGGQSPLLAFLGYWWFKYGRKKEAEPAPVKVGAETKCSFRVTNQGQIERTHDSVSNVIPRVMETHAQILRDINTTQQQMSVALATIASSNQNLHEKAIEDSVRLRRIEKDASAALKYNQWVQERERSGP